MLKIAVLISGRGSNFKAILENIKAGHINAEIALVLSNVPDAPGLAFAREEGIPVWAESHKAYPSRAAFDAAMLDAMKKTGVMAVVLAGYMRLLSPEFIQAYSGKIINIHPALLPAFSGTSGGPDALAYGVKLAGCTVHFVVEEMDAGPIIIQAAVPVDQADTEVSLMSRIHVLEHRIFSQALAWLADERLVIKGRAVRLLPPNSGMAASGAAPMLPCLIHPPLEIQF